MDNTKKDSGRSSMLMNIAIIFLSVLLVFLLFQLFYPRSIKEDSSHQWVSQEEVFTPPAPETVAVKSEPVAVSPAPVLEAPVTAGKFVIQIGSFQDQKKADAVAESLKKKGYAPVVEAKDLGSKGIWYRVSIGGFETKDHAQGLLDAVKKDHAGAFIKQL